MIGRRVYHHLTDSMAINASLLRALHPGGVLAVIDFPPLVSWLWVLNHGVDARRVTEEAVASGCKVVQVIEDWPGRGPLGSYCVVFSTLGNKMNDRATAGVIARPPLLFVAALLLGLTADRLLFWPFAGPKADLIGGLLSRVRRRV